MSSLTEYKGLFFAIISLISSRQGVIDTLEHVCSGQSDLFIIYSHDAAQFAYSHHVNDGSCL